MTNESTPSDVVAARVKDVRLKRKLTVAQLAARCAEMGAPELTAHALYKLEARRPGKLRPRPVTVDELLALSAALNVPPVSLLVPPWPGGINQPYAVTPTVTESRWIVRWWVRGLVPIAGGEPQDYFAELPRDEFYQRFMAQEQLFPRPEEADDGERQETP